MFELLDRLERFYGPLPQPPDDPFALYVWQVLDLQTTPARRDAALKALKRIPALTPDSMSHAPRAKLEQAVALAGSYREERLRALAAGVDVFRRNRDLPQRLRAGHDIAAAALELLPHLTAVSGQWLLLFGGDHGVLPEDTHLMRVVHRLGTRVDDFSRELGGVPSALRRAALYLVHHGRATCVEADPLCRVCPLRMRCPFAKGAAAGVH
jgi:endonuclease III